MAKAKIYRNRWKRGESIGAGGQADVFLVQDMDDSEKPYALKRLRNPARMERFEREVAALGKLEHNGIISVIDSFVEDNTAFYVMPLMEGGNLEDRVESCKGDIQRSLRLVLAICDAVQAAHTAKITHRDLKPENILFRRDTDDSPVVSDFGICHLLGMERLTATSEAVGPRYFMAPELEGGKSDQVGPHNDIYSLGKLLYYIVSGGTSLPRERHRQAEHDLRQRLTGDSLVSVRSCQLEYVSRLLDHMVTEEVSDRPSDVLNCISGIRQVLSLVEEGRYPITDNMPCRFCGIGEYHLMPGDPVRVGGPFAGQRYMYCQRCGHCEAFLKEIFESNDSIGMPPKGW